MATEVGQSNVFSPEFFLDPYALITRLRLEEPVHFVPHMSAWFLTRHDDVRQFMADTDLVTSDSRAWESYRPPVGPNMRWAADNNLRALERGDHLRLRRLAAAAFTPRAIARIDRQIREVVAHYASPLRGRAGVVDLMSALIDPVPIAVICRITGISAEGQSEARFRELAQPVVAAFLPFASADAFDEAEDAMGELADWVREVARARQRDPQDDLISDLMTAVEGGDRVTVDEAVLLLASLIMAGSETAALGGMVCLMSLLSRPEVMEGLRQDRAAIDRAVLEIIRRDMSGPGFLGRYALRDFELRGRQIRAGQMLMLSFGLANLDPAAFPDPDAFDIDRDQSNLLAFGHGVHYCLGAHLAKAELRQVVDALLDIVPPNAQIRFDLMQFRTFNMFPRPTSLPVDLGKG
jgi:cytochrome P450